MPEKVLVADGARCDREQDEHDQKTENPQKVPIQLLLEGHHSSLDGAEALIDLLIGAFQVRNPDLEGIRGHAALSGES